MMKVKWVEHFKGWVAVKSGRFVRTRDRRVKVFSTIEGAMRAWRKSRM